MRRFCSLLLVTVFLIQGCEYMQHTVTDEAQGVAFVSEQPAVDTPAVPQRGVQEALAPHSVFDPNNYSGTDSERINAAMKDAGTCGGTVRIGKRRNAVQISGGNAIIHFIDCACGYF